MERLTPGVQTAYPVERTIMETGSEGRSAKPTVKKPLEARMADVVKKFGQKQQEKAQNIRKKENKDESASGSGGTGGGRFDKFDPDKFKGNTSLEELAKLVKAAARQGKLDAQFLEDIKTQLDRRTQLGLVSDNWNRNFTDYLNEFIVSENLSEAKGDHKELSQDIETIVASRKSRGLSPEEYQASIVAMEAAFGRKLSPEEVRRVAYGEKITGASEQAKKFEVQVSLIEEVAGNAKRFDSFIESLKKLDGETIKRVLNDKGGEVVLGILLGDVADNREQFFEKFRKELGGHPDHVRASLSVLAREIEKEEQRQNPKVNPERQRLAREQAEKWIEEQKKRRQVTAEEIDGIFNNAERGIPVIAGGADFYEAGLNLLESIDSVPDEVGEAFTNAKANLVDDERITLLAEDMYGVNSPRIREETERVSNIRNIDDPRLFKQRYKQFLNDLLKRYQEAMNDPKRGEERRETEAAARELTGTGEKTKGGKTFNIKGIEDIAEAISPRKEGERPFFEREPKNVKEVAAWIMAGDDRSVWGPDGVYPIFVFSDELDAETGKPKAEFRPQNFLRWLRNKSLEHHADNPNDPLNLLSGISIETLFKSISILQMKYQKQKYFADENGRPLSDLADEVINEAWLFGVRRNKNLGYIQAMNSDEKLFEAIVEMSGKNDHTGGENLANHFRMGEEYNHDGKGIDNRVGDAMLAANHIYRNISDIDKLRQILPPNSPIFTVEGFKNASRYLNGQGFNEDTKGFGNLKIEGNRVYFLDPRTKIHTEIFKPDGSLESDASLVKFLNFFPAANPEETNETFVRELTKQSIADIVGFDAGMEKRRYEKFVEEQKEKLRDNYKNISIEEYRKLMRMNLEWAEINSWVEQRWNGAAARNDTGYRGYDAWTKMYAQYYRERQSGSRTAGPIGNPHDMQIFRLLTPDMWLAIRTESGESVHEIFEELHMTNLSLYKLTGELTPEQEAEKKALEEKKKASYGKLRFPRWTESDWASNGVKRQSEVWHNMMNTEDLKFNELAKRDTWGVLRYDRQKFEEVVKDDFIKKRRYAFSSNNAMNYGAMTRMRVRTAVEFNKDGTVVEGSEKYIYVDKPLAEAMFGDVVIKSIKDEWYDGKLEFEGADANGKKVIKVAPKKGDKFDPDKHGTYQEFLNSAKAREKILKNVCRAGIAAQIKSHRERAGTTERWDTEVVRKLYQSLRSMPQYIEDPLTGEERRVDGSQFFSEEDIKWIRKQTNTGKGMLLFEDSYHMGWDMLAGGLPDIFKLFYQDIVS